MKPEFNRMAIEEIAFKYAPALWLAFLVIALAVLASGCAIATAPRVKSTTTTTAKTGEVVVEEKETKGAGFIVWGDAKAMAEKIKVSNGKTHSIGVSGESTETAATNVAPIISSAGALIGEAARKFMGAP